MHTVARHSHAVHHACACFCSCHACMDFQLPHRLPTDITKPFDVSKFFSDLSPLTNARRFDDRWDRLCSQQVEANVEVLWQEQLAKNPLLFNGSKFRLAGYSTEGDHSVTATANAAAASVALAPAAKTATKADISQGEDGTVTPPPPPPRSRSPSSPPTRRLRLRLGLTDYRTFRGENDKFFFFMRPCALNSAKEGKVEGGREGGFCR